MSTLPAVGSHVRVQWGFDTVEGEVVDAYDSGFGKRVVVSVTLEGSDEPMTATFRAEAVELAAQSRDQAVTPAGRQDRADVPAAPELPVAAVQERELPLAGPATGDRRDPLREAQPSSQGTA